MKKIVKISGVWAVVDDREIIECFDTRYDAEEYFEPERQRQALIQFDKIRNWSSYYDYVKESC